MLAQKHFFMYNIVMKKISVLLIFSLILMTGYAQMPVQAGIFAKHKAKIEQKKLYKSTIKDILSVIEKQDSLANKHDLKGITELYSEDFLNSDGFNKNAYLKLIEETWKTYPDISYITEIRNIEFTDNYATVFVNETAIATSVEQIGEFETTGELYSTAKSVYHLEKCGNDWLINAERIIEETTTLKYGDARYINIELSAPKQTGTNRYYTATLKVDAPKNSTVVGSISRDKIIYPQTKSEDSFRRIYDNVLERVFLANSDNVNEYAVGSVGITHAEGYDESRIRVYLSGMAFIMTRVNVIPENKFINIEDEEK